MRPLGIAAGMIKQLSHVPKGLEQLVDHITFGSFTLKPRDGNKEPVYWFDEERQASINAVGLKNQGLPAFLDEMVTHEAQFRELIDAGCKIRLSLAPLVAGELIEMVKILYAYKEIVSWLIHEVESNAACPNHRSDGGKLHDVLAHDPIALKALMKEGSLYTGRKAIKIAPYMNPESLFKCVVNATMFGFDTIVSGNTLKQSSIIGGVQRLSVDQGGMAGTPLLKSGVEQVSYLKALTNRIVETQRPNITGCGGIMNAPSARKYLDAGADTGQVATYYMQYGVNGVRDLVSELV